MKTLFGPSRLKRSLFFLTGDIVLLSLTLVAGYYLRFDLHLPHYHQLPLLLWMPVVVLMKILLLRIFGLYNISWSFVGLVELVNILKALTIALFIFFIGNLYIKLAAPTLAVPRSIILLDFVLGVAAWAACGGYLAYALVRALEDHVSVPSLARKPEEHRRISRSTMRPGVGWV
jgi:UDP-N-acetyl-D-glucosamine 4,6-dehydratase